MRKFLITTPDLYQDTSSVYEMKQQQLYFVKPPSRPTRGATLSSTFNFGGSSSDLKFVYSIILPYVFRACVKEGRYRDLACLAFTDTSTVLFVYTRIFIDQHRRDAFRERIDETNRATVRISRLAKTFELLDTLIELFHGSEHYGVLQPDVLPIFQFQAAPDPGWQRAFEPWEWTGDLVVDFVKPLPIFEDERDYTSVVTGDRFGDRMFVSGSQRNGILSATFYRNPVVCLKALDIHGNCQGSKTIFSKSKNWFAVTCLLYSYLGRDAGVFYLLDSSEGDLNPELMFGPIRPVYWQYDKSSILNSNVFKQINKV